MMPNKLLCYFTSIKIDGFQPMGLRKKILWGGCSSLLNTNKSKQFENWLVSFHYCKSNYIKKSNLKCKENKKEENSIAICSSV